MKSLEVLFTPADFGALSNRDLSNTVCVVFDVLRATSSMVTALANGANGIIPVQTIDEALSIRRSQPEVLLAGEREGLRIRADQTGSIDFDFGNSPREFVRTKVDGKSIAMTTTNGTLALKACAGARRIFPAAFLNISAVARAVEAESNSHLIVVCAGTFEQAAYEDTLAAGAFCSLVWPQFEENQIADSAQMARNLFQLGQNDISKALNFSRNARRLWSRPDLHDDVAYSMQRDLFLFATELRGDTVRIA